jgi:hypothetical protein
MAGEQMRSLLLVLMVALGTSFGVSQEPSRPLFDSKSKDGLDRRLVYANGDYCHVREYAGEEHIGLRLTYMISERIVSIPDVKSLITKVANQFAGKRERALILKALQGYRDGVIDSDHWRGTIQDQGYSEFYVSVDWVSESVLIQIKYSR